MPNEENTYDVIKDVSYADHPLVIGPRYQLDDVRCAWANYLGTHVSGVFRKYFNVILTFRNNLRILSIC